MGYIYIYIWVNCNISLTWIKANYSTLFADHFPACARSGLFCSDLSNWEMVPVKLSPQAANTSHSQTSHPTAFLPVSSQSFQVFNQRFCRKVKWNLGKVLHCRSVRSKVIMQHLTHHRLLCKLRSWPYTSTPRGTTLLIQTFHFTKRTCGWNHRFNNKRLKLSEHRISICGLLRKSNVQIKQRLLRINKKKKFTPSPFPSNR